VENNKEEVLEELDNKNNEQVDTNDIVKLKEELSEQTKKADEYYEHLKRNMAEFDNYKKSY